VLLAEQVRDLREAVDALPAASSSSTADRARSDGTPVDAALD
jgi:hypothetical protein